MKRPATDRCPHCGWLPTPGSRWSCTCGASFDTFDTGGECPTCHKVWTELVCLRCTKWSERADWPCRHESSIRALEAPAVATIRLPVRDGDDPDFIELVHHLILGSLTARLSPEIYAVRVDNWFGKKWYRFIGTTSCGMGTVGWRNWGPPVVPPFVANRIAEQHAWALRAGIVYESIGNGADLHHEGPSIDNHRRYLAEVRPGASVFWYSSDTARTGRGSIMGYAIVGDGYDTWYLGLHTSPSLRVETRSSSFHERQLRMTLEAGGYPRDLG